jgi:hypothetical protein
MRRFRILAVLAWAVGAGMAAAVARPFSLVTYNVENLFDLDGVAGFEDYRPEKYTPAHALTKLQNIARVVARFEDGRGPDVLVFNELELDRTPGTADRTIEQRLAPYAGMTLAEMLGAKFDAAVADLPAEALLAKALAERGLTGYRVILPERGAAEGTGRPLEHTNAIFTRFPVKMVRSHPTTDARTILEAELEIDGARLYVFANHWKSGASDPATEPTRVANARTLRARLDEIWRDDPNADIVLAGDFNSQYNHRQRYPAMKTTGINDVLGSQGNELAIRGPQRALYNLWYELPEPERGSDTFRGEWGTLMHVIVSRGLYDFRGVQYVDNSFAVGKFPGLNADAKGLPVRWSGDGPAGSGFSDHFPLVARFTTVPDNRTDRYLALRQPGAERPGPPPSTKIDFSRIDLEKTAVKPESLAAGTSILTEDNKGKLFRVVGTVAAGSRLAVEFRGETIDIWTFDEALRNRLRAEHKAGDTIRFYGELGTFRGRWQFVIQDPAWVK